MTKHCARKTCSRGLLSLAAALLSLAPAVPAADECQSTAKPKGQGTYVAPDCTRYEGTFRGDYLWGPGRITYPDGRVVEGDFQVNQLFGKGVTTWPDGRRYEGQFRHGQSFGVGVYRNADGVRDEGLFRPGAQLHGWGTRGTPDGAMLIGEFRSGEPFGKLLKINADGSRQVVEFPLGSTARQQATGTDAAPQPESQEESPVDGIKKSVNEVNKKLRSLRGILGQ
jgi:hypothetical protein